MAVENGIVLGFGVLSLSLCILHEKLLENTYLKIKKKVYDLTSYVQLFLQNLIILNLLITIRYMAENAVVHNNLLNTWFIILLAFYVMFILIQIIGLFTKSIMPLKKIDPFERKDKSEM